MATVPKNVHSFKFMKYKLLFLIVPQSIPAFMISREVKDHQELWDKLDKVETPETTEPTEPQELQVPQVPPELKVCEERLVASEPSDHQ